MNGNFDYFVISLLLTPVISGVLVTVLRKKRTIEVITATSMGLVLIQCLFLVYEISSKKSISAFGEFFYADAVSAFVILPIAGVGFITSLYSINYIGRQYDTGVLDQKRLVRYYQGFNAFIFTMLLVPLSNNIGIMWVAIEATTLVSVLLIMLYVKESAIEASWKYLIVATVGLSFALFGIILFNYANIGSTSPDDATNWTSLLRNAKSLDPNIIKIAFVFVLVGLGTKAGLAPMHTWLPDAHSEAPTPVSALLSGVLLNCAIYGIIRFHMISSAGMGSGFSGELLIILGVISMGIAAVSIYFQKDMKRLLAFSSIEHMGIISVAIGFGGFLGIYGGMLHMINHSVAKPLMFFASGTISQKYETKAISKIRGIIKTMPLTGALFLIGGLAIIGLPPFGIFLSEFFVLSSGFDNGQFVAILFMLVFLVVIFAGFIKHLVSMIFGTPEKEMKKGELGKLSIIPMIILGVLTIVLGIYLPDHLKELTNDASRIIGGK
ncbi:MAG: hydrogenase 4 subunit F [Candidatus Nitrosotenuis sp.]|nr:MAG: hydrogenase 4 subunit F [Candidatus Nitrosotenuis sp.]